MPERGWYPDPFGPAGSESLRLWDGQGWTDQRQGPAPASQRQGPAPVVEVKHRRLVRARISVILAAVALVIIVGLIISRSTAKGGLSTAAQSATAARLAHLACARTPDLSGDGRASCDGGTIIVVWGSASERDANLAQLKTAGTGMAFVKAETWFIGCPPSAVPRIAAATGGKAA